MSYKTNIVIELDELDKSFLNKIDSYLHYINTCNNVDVIGNYLRHTYDLVANKHGVDSLMLNNLRGEENGDYLLFTNLPRNQEPKLPGEDDVSL